jgi:hypothetical protein
VTGLRVLGSGVTTSVEIRSMGTAGCKIHDVVLLALPQLPQPAIAVR